MNLQYNGNPFVPYSSQPAIRQETPKPQKRYQKPLLLTTAEAGDYIGVSSDTLCIWRCTQSTQIPFVRIGGSKRGYVRYRVKDLEKYLEKQLNIPEGWDDE